MNAMDCLLVKMLRRPDSVCSLRLEDWDLLLRQARYAGLIARLYFLLDEHNLLSEVPTQPVAHLKSAYLDAMAHKRAVCWEVDRIQRALTEIDIAPILLKGAAYVSAELPTGHGRMFSDIDILVPKGKLKEVEMALLRHGWVSTHHDAYDQRYYRTWMHELPPLKHVKRKAVLDVHHNILPETARLHPDADKLRKAAVTIDGDIRVLAPVDMVLHSATHLFHDGELEQGLRDLVDLDSLLSHFSQDGDFWPKLVERAKEMDLVRPLYYALRYTRNILGTQVSEQAYQSIRGYRPSWPGMRFMDALFLRGLAPDHPSCDTRLVGLVRWLLYVRGHALRMPMHLLLPHLFRKALRRHGLLSAA